MSNNTINILVLNSDADFRNQLTELLSASNYRLEFIEKLTEALKQILKNKYDAIILELDPDRESGAETIPIINQIDDTLPIITITSEDSLETQRQIRKGKIFYHLVKPTSGDEIKSAIEHAIAKHSK